MRRAPSIQLAVVTAFKVLLGMTNPRKIEGHSIRYYPSRNVDRSQGGLIVHTKRCFQLSTGLQVHRERPGLPELVG